MSAEERGNLLIFRIGSIGDTVVALPCFHAIARAFPRERKVLLTNAVPSARAASVEAILDGTGLIDQTLYFPLGSAKLDHSLTLLRELRRLDAVALVYLAPRPTLLPVYRDLLLFKVAGIRRILGAPLGTGSRQCRVDPATDELEYEAERLARVLGTAIPVDLSAPNWDLRLSVAERATADKCLALLPRWRPVVALAPGARQPAKDWGERNWASLITLLRQRCPDISLVFVGAPDERPIVERLAPLWSDDKVNLCGELTPRESAAVLRRCDLFVGHDSGPMHLAASQGTACVALFGNFNRPRQWFPFGPQHEVIHEPRGIHAIGVGRVADVIEAAVHGLRNAAVSESQHCARAVSC
jgi:ADP-heptose:LPS heptosyltransferase